LSLGLGRLKAGLIGSLLAPVACCYYWALQGKFEDLEARIASIEADLEELRIPQQAWES
jgi:hypothetical protein